MRAIVCLLLLCVWMPGCRTAPVSTPIGLQHERTARIAKAIRETMQEQHIPGLSIAVVDNGQLAWAQGFGYRDKDRQLPVDTETRFQAGSISKPVTALALLHLAAAGKVRLDDDVNTCLKSWRLDCSDGGPVTLRQLACHYGGTGPHGFQGYSEFAGMPSLVDVMSNRHPGNGPVKVMGKPGTEFRYSGGGYCVIQLAMEDATGTPFDQLMAETLLGPLQMTQSHFRQPPSEADALNSAHGHGRTKRRPEGRWNVFPQKSAAGLWTTPCDLAKLVMAVQTAAAGDESGAIAPGIAREFLKRQFDDTMGMGVFLDGKEGQRGFFHGGENTGFFAAFGAGVSNGRAWVIMTNAQKNCFEPIIKTVVQEFAWK